jgi:hypothetical protein
MSAVEDVWPLGLVDPRVPVRLCDLVGASDTCHVWKDLVPPFQAPGMLADLGMSCTCELDPSATLRFAPRSALSGSWL